MFNSSIKRNPHLLKCCCSLTSRKSFSNALANSLQIKSLESSDRVRKKLPFQNYFIENLFVNKFQKNILEYPQINSLKEVEELTERYNYSQNLLAASSSNLKILDNGNPSRNVINNIKNLGLSGFKASITKGGFGYLNSEFAYLQESLNDNLSLAKIVAENENFGVEIINNFGNDNQKEKYIRSLSLGDSMACFGHMESTSNFYSPFNSESIQTKAILHSNCNHFQVTGRKKWVFNANHSNLIIFSAIVEDNNTKDQKNITMFAVDKNTSGIVIHEPIKTIGLKGVEVCDISFNDLVIPFDSVLGKINEGNLILKKLYSTREFNNSVHCLAAMKKLLDITIQHCLHKKYLEKYKCDQDYFKSVIGRIVSRIYVAESMVYLVGGRMDSFIDSDLFLESLILKVFSSESLQFILSETMDLIGLDSLIDNTNLKLMINDCYFLLANDYTNNYFRLVLSETGYKHFLKVKEKINPILKFGEYLNNLNPLMQKPRKKYFIKSKSILSGYLHLMFEEESKILEDLLLRFYTCSKFIFNKYNGNVLSRQTELIHLANLVIYIYAVTALLGRASRAYSLGARNQEVDKSIAECEVFRLHSEFVKNETLIKSYLFIENFEKIHADTFLISQMKNHHPVLVNL